MKFVLEFYDSDFESKGYERPSTKFSFDLILPFPFDSKEWIAWDNDFLLEKVSEMEEHGVHDYMANSDTDGSWIEFGYHSYEIDQNKWDNIVSDWREWFVEQGFEPGLIKVEILSSEDE